MLLGGLFEGIPAGHILKGFNKEAVSYYSTGGSGLKFSRSHLIQLVENLNSEEEDILINNKQILNEKEIVEDKPSESKGTDKEEGNPTESKGTDKEESNPTESKGTDKKEGNPTESKGTDKEEGKPNEVKSSGIFDEEDAPSESISNKPENLSHKQVNQTDNKANNLNISNLIYILILLSQLL